MSVFNNIRSRKEFEPDPGFLQIKTIDLHTGGEPLRVIVEGFPELKGSSILDYRKYCQNHFDHLRKLLILEPRGHKDMYGCILTRPNDEEADFGVIFLHNDGYSTMCGHAIIALTSLAVELNWIQVHEGRNSLKIDTPCGRISSFAQVNNGKVISVQFHCVPSFVVGLNKSVEVPGIGIVHYDLAYGGAFYAYVDMTKNSFDFDLSKASYQQLIVSGMKIKQAVINQVKDLSHPFEKDLGFLYGTIFLEKSNKADVHSRNVCIFADGEVDRCPTGSGVSGRMAIHYKRNELGVGEKMNIESITDSVFKASVIKEVDFGPYKAVIPQVEGTAYITGMHTFVLDPNDPLKNGFILK